MIRKQEDENGFLTLLVLQKHENVLATFLLFTLCSALLHFVKAWALGGDLRSA